jgi:hypothetical protein
MHRWENLSLTVSAVAFVGFFSHVAYAAATRAPMLGVRNEALILLFAVLCFAAGCLGREARMRRHGMSQPGGVSNDNEDA